jgi:hypothetical protein
VTLSAPPVPSLVFARPFRVRLHSAAWPQAKLQTPYSGSYGEARFSAVKGSHAAKKIPSCATDRQASGQRRVCALQTLLFVVVERPKRCVIPDK